MIQIKLDCALGFVEPSKTCIIKKINWGLEKALFPKKNASKRGELKVVKKMTCLVLLFENVCYSPLFEALF